MLFFVTGTKSRTCFPSERRSLIGQLHQFQIALSLSLMSLPLLLVSSDIRVLAASLVSSDIRVLAASLVSSDIRVLAASLVSSDICPCSQLGQFWQHTNGGNSIWRNYYSQVGGSSSEGDAQRIIPKMGAKRHLLSPWRSVGYSIRWFQGFSTIGFWVLTYPKWCSEQVVFQDSIYNIQTVQLLIVVYLTGAFFERSFAPLDSSLITAI